MRTFAIVAIAALLLSIIPALSITGYFGVWPWAGVAGW